MGSGRAGLSRRGRDALQQDARHPRRDGGAPTRRGAVGSQPPRRRPRGTGCHAGTTTYSRASRNRRADDRAGRDAAHPGPRAVSAGCRLRAAPAGTRADGRGHPGTADQQRRLPPPRRAVDATSRAMDESAPSNRTSTPLPGSARTADGAGNRRRRRRRPRPGQPGARPPDAVETGGNGRAARSRRSLGAPGAAAEVETGGDGRAARSRHPYRPDGGECRSAIMKRLAGSR